MIIDHSIGDVYQHDISYLSGANAFVLSLAVISAVAAIPPEGAVKIVHHSPTTAVCVLDPTIPHIIHSSRVAKVVK